MSSFFDDNPYDEEDEEEFQKRYITPAKRTKTTFFRSLDLVIRDQLEEYQQRKQLIELQKLEENADVIKNFLGDVSSFEQASNQGRDSMCKFIRQRTIENLNYYPYKINKCFTDEQQNWILNEYWIIYRVLARVFVQYIDTFNFDMLTKQSIPYYHTQHMSELVLSNIVKSLRTAMNISEQVMVQIPTAEDNVRNQKIRAKVIEEAVSSGYDRQQSEQLIAIFPNVGLIERLSTVRPKIVDDLPNNDDDFDLIEAMLNPPAVETLNFVIEERPPREQMQVKSILKKEVGKYYSDFDVHDLYNVKECERKLYSDTYSLLVKKIVKFTDIDPECFITTTNHAQNAINVHKKECGNREQLAYVFDVRKLGYWEGESFNSGIKVTYDFYQAKLHPVQPAVASSRNRKKEHAHHPHVILKKPILSRKNRNQKGTLVIPAHDEMQPTAEEVCPLMKQNEYLLANYKKLLSYGNFWDIVRTRTSVYNNCYGPMIIADGILEQAKQDSLLNTGLFTFPYPFNKMTVLEMFNQINPSEFGMTDIILVWGWNHIYFNTENSGDALIDAITLYSLLKAKINQKIQEFEAMGFNRLSKPNYWLTTIPKISEDSPFNNDILKFNKKLRLFCQATRTGIIDWDQNMVKGGVYVSEDSGEAQIINLYKALETAGVKRFRSYIDAQEEDCKPNYQEWIRRRQH